jgi:MATE family multidrug resistance protein
VTIENAWHGRVWRLAVPNILANLTIPLLGAVDTAVVGRLGASEIGAVTVGATIFSFLYWGFSFLRMGTAGLAAQAHGAGDRPELFGAFGRGALLATIFGLTLVALQVPIAALAMWVISPSDAVAPFARDYLMIRIWAAPAALINMVILGWLIGRQRMVVALYLQLLINGTNIVLDLGLAVGLEMAVPGVALATALAQGLGLIAGLWVMNREARLAGTPWPWSAIFDRARLVAMTHLNLDIMVRTLCLITVVSMFTALGARFGDLVLAANGILLLFQAFMSYGLDGFAHATEALVGEAIGRRDGRALAAAVRASTLWAGITSVGYTLVYWLLGPVLVGLVTTVPEVRATTAEFLPWAVVAPLVSIWSYQLDGIFIGATRGRAMRNAMVISFLAYLAMLAVMVPMWGNHGLWLTFMIFMVVRAATLAAHYPGLVRAATKLP